ncbi:MAG TPA: PVC-type heme-binding CxxCH protein [Gemmataceae bacterium]|nr:PVC-type heme-binding CxxCH protein [Gemmataceae bacterium]
MRTAAAVFAILLILALEASSVHPQADNPETVVSKMQTAEGFAVQLVACEPLVRKPVAIEFDDRGRPWVIQYLQYPNPAGLKRVRVDRYSRTVYDRMPEPPPRGPKGADRITILEGMNAEGRAMKARDFVAGLNLATGLAFGHGGVFVLQAPYLLYYPDRDGDDVPDGPPDVLLAGFGMEDASSVANSLTWGPDGWLYGCQGSTATARIRGIEFQQGVWRYHPITHRFELFCEGGGNCWGLDFDAHGELCYSTNFGGHIMVHGVPGAYYWKQFDKHGGLSNPHAYGYLDHVPHRHFRGGHVTVGGILYQSDSFPERFRNKLIAADLLGHAVYWHDLEPNGSTFRSSHGGELLLAKDLSFAPSDVTVGPDGAVYVCDWHDKRTAHPDPDAEWDRSKGRIYRIAFQGTRPYAGEDVRKLSSARLVSLLSSKNDWLVRKARRVLADRRDPEVIFPLRRLVLESKDDALALQALWALYVSGGFTEGFAAKALGHHNPDVRRWTVRFLGDEGRVSAALSERLRELAVHEPDVRVRSQLACSAKRLPPRDALPLIERLALRAEDAKDPYIPLLLWWAVERHALTAREGLVEFFSSRKAWDAPLIREALEERLLRRYAAEGTEASFRACARLLAAAPSDGERSRLITALDLGLQDHSTPRQRKTSGSLLTPFAVVERNTTQAAAGKVKLPAVLMDWLRGQWQDSTTDPAFLRLMIRLGHRPAQEQAVKLALDPGTPLKMRLTMLRTLGEAATGDCVEPLRKLLVAGEAEAVRLAAMETLQRFDDPRISEALLRDYGKMNARLRSRARAVLFSRKTWAFAFLKGVERGTYPAAEVAVEELRPLALFKDKKLDAMVHKHWGNIRPGTPEEKLAEVRRLTNDLRAGKGNVRAGHELYRTHCASCHRLFGEGEPVGPELTHANRKDRDYLLVSIVDPSALIRKEYVSYVVQTTDGRVLTGLMVAQTPGSITLVGAKNERTTIPREKIESIQESPVSLMPENLLRQLKPRQVRDLFAYLQSAERK